MGRELESKRYYGHWSDDEAKRIAKACVLQYEKVVCPECDAEIGFSRLDSEKDLRKEYVGKAIIIEFWCEKCKKSGTQHFRI